MQIMTNPYFALQNYSGYFQIQDSKVIPEVESQGTQSADKKSNSEESKEANPNAPQAPNGEKLDASEQQYVRELAAIDANVRAHEAAHIGAGAGVVSGGATFGYTRGPDGKMYATSGEVPISMKEGRTPEETIQNARQIISAAMAPADPSPQDYKVAASAAQMEVQARSEQARERVEEVEEQGKEPDNTQDTQEQESISKSAEDFTNQDSTNPNPQNASNQRQYSSKSEYIKYAIQSYTANATSNSYIPRLDIAG